MNLVKLLTKSKLLVSAAMVLSWNIGGIIAPAGAQVTDYANYPGNSGVPSGCDYSGVEGVSFSQELGSLNPGDVLTMSWENVIPECDGSPIAIALKLSEGIEFDASVNQRLHPNYSIGTLVAGSAGSLSFEMPNLNEDQSETCFYQLDAILGQPLSIVGPNGSFYGSGLRGSGPHLLIAAANGSQECEAPPVEPEPEPVAPPALDVAPVAPLSVAPVAPPVAVGTTTTQPTSGAVSEAPRPLSEQVALAARPQLAATGAEGSSVVLPLLVALLLIASGICCLYARKTR